ncbi:MAG: hypothetical protein HY319_29295 [Armatimonadetes bacterium]|nr:hypothetical protein [Armatimonadota bacterium]
MRTLLILVAILMACPAWANPRGCHSDKHCEKRCDRPLVQQPNPTLRDPVPVRWVCPEVIPSDYYYGYGGYGYDYGYTYSLENATAAFSPSPSLSPPSEPRQPAQPDPRSRQTAFLRETLARYIAGQSVAGRFSLNDPTVGKSKSWLLAYAGTPSFQSRGDGTFMAWIPFRGRLGTDPTEHQVEVNVALRQTGEQSFEVERVLIVRVNGHERAAAYRE